VNNVTQAKNDKYEKTNQQMPKLEDCTNAPAYASNDSSE